MQTETICKITLISFILYRNYLIIVKFTFVFAVYVFIVIAFVAKYC